ncbi:DUF6701 domain-containing protein [Aliikangiella maris]|uniref:DUF6701 domain-containing protein n=2 Tax=Aliikangiella maris TaxID=3162458 RepID=A0ABV3MLU4_9GAMM
MLWLTLCLFSASAVNAAYQVQVVTGEAFDTVTTDVVWNNDASQTDYPIDDDYQLVNIGFTFYLGETAYTQVRVMANGVLHFGANQGFHKDYTNETLPITGVTAGPGYEEPADRVIAGYWDDLEPSLGGTIRYDTLGTAPYRRFVASWNNVPRYNGPGTSYSFQIVIFENGNVRFRYGNDEATGGSATIGIEVSDTDYTQYSSDTALVNDSIDLLWIRQFPTLTEAAATCADVSKVTLTFASAISPARAADINNFAINNGISILAANYIDATTVELTTSSLDPDTTYTVSTSYPTQSTTFNLSTSSTTVISDDFSSGTYSGGSGWAGNWLESDDDGSATTGNVFVFGGRLYLDDSPDTGGFPAIEREIDLSNFTSANLSVLIDSSLFLEGSDRFEIAVSPNGGASWTVLGQYQNEVSGTYTFDLTPYLTVNTRIRFQITFNYGGFLEYVTFDNITIIGIENTPCAPELDHFVVTHDSNGINCLREPITIAAVDDSGDVITDYSGTIDLSLVTNHGNWFTLDESNNSTDLAQGTLVDTANDNDGAATYTFVEADSGNVILYLQNTVAEATNINVAEGITTDDNTEGDITFRPYGFVVSPAPITTQVAGKPFDLVLTAAGQTPTQSNCGVIEEYNGTQAIHLWSTYQTPTTSPTQVLVNATPIATTQVTASPQNITFNAGQATLTVQYNDVGQISLGAKDESGIGDPTSGNVDEIIGGVSPFVVRPFGYDLQVAGSPYADDENDTVFAIAGDNFGMTIRSVLWQAGDDLDNDGIPDPFIDTDNDAIPDSGGNLADNGITPNISQISGNISLQPQAILVTNSNGSLGQSLIDFSNFPAPTASQPGIITITQNWDEVGILQIDALSSNFMATSDNITGQRINIGRFIPAQFNLTITTDYSAQCGSFSYAGFNNGVTGLNKIGQSHNLVFGIQAVNQGNAATANYDGQFAKLEIGTITLTPFDTLNGVTATGNLSTTRSPIIFNTSGQSTASFTDLYYQFAGFSAPVELQINITAQDSDDVSGIISSATVNNRLGRLKIIDAYGPETSSLELRLFSEYYNGTQWLTNTLDNCTSYIQTNSILTPTSYTDNLNDGETSIFFPTTNQPLSNGQSILASGLLYSAPGEGNFGSVETIYNLSTLSWLTYDWDEDLVNDNPVGILNFGHYRGSDRIIYWRELKN